MPKRATSKAATVRATVPPAKKSPAAEAKGVPTEQNSGKAKLRIGTARKRATRRGRRRNGFDVKALRGKLQASREAFAKLLGVSAGSIYNWEHGEATITRKNLAKLEALAAATRVGTVSLRQRRGRGRPRATTAAPETPPRRRSRGAKVAISGAVPITYANVASIVNGSQDAAIHFGLALPDATARAVLTVVVPGDVLRSLRG